MENTYPNKKQCTESRGAIDSDSTLNSTVENTTSAVAEELASLPSSSSSSSSFSSSSSTTSAYSATSSSPAQQTILSYFTQDLICYELFTYLTDKAAIRFLSSCQLLHRFIERYEVKSSICISPLSIPTPFYIHSIRPIPMIRKLHLDIADCKDKYGEIKLTQLLDAMRMDLHRLQYIRIDYGKCEMRTFEMLPTNLEGLELYSDGRFEDCPKFPCGLKELQWYAYDINFVFKPGILPDTLEKLEFHLKDYGRLTLEPNALPCGLRILLLDTLDYCYPIDEGVENILPVSLEELYLRIDDITSVLVPRLLPHGLKKFRLVDNNGETDEAYDALCDFNWNDVTPSLEVLELPSNNIPPSMIFPSLIQELNVNTLTLPHPSGIPSSLRKLTIYRVTELTNNSYHQLQNLEELYLGFDHYHEDECYRKHPIADLIIEPNTFPASLKKLRFNKHVKRSIDKSWLPSGLKVLILPYALKDKAPVDFSGIVRIEQENEESQNQEEDVLLF